MCELYPNHLQIAMEDCAKEYSIPFPSYVDKKSYQRVAKDEMFIRNMAREHKELHLRLGDVVKLRLYA